MLILTRRLNESIRIGTDIEITIVQINKHSIKLGINAPKSVSVFRKELYEMIQKENIAASQAGKEKIESLKSLINKENKDTIK